VGRWLSGFFAESRIADINPSVLVQEGEALMQIVTNDWLHDRGGLHDASIVEARWNGSSIEIFVNDEWANERGLGLPHGVSPGHFLIADATVEGDLVAFAGGWVSEINFIAGRLHFEMTNRASLLVFGCSFLWCGVGSRQS
jgi:hypothetical protein